MSNTSVGAVYAQIMADVIDSSRIDFEEMGVEESVLEELKKVSTQDNQSHHPSLIPHIPSFWSFVSSDTVSVTFKEHDFKISFIDSSLLIASSWVEVCRCVQCGR